MTPAIYVMCFMFTGNPAMSDYCEPLTDTSIPISMETCQLWIQQQREFEISHFGHITTEGVSTAYGHGITVTTERRCL